MSQCRKRCALRVANIPQIFWTDNALKTHFIVGKPLVTGFTGVPTLAAWPSTILLQCVERRTVLDPDEEPRELWIFRRRRTDDDLQAEIMMLRKRPSETYHRFISCWYAHEPSGESTGWRVCDPWVNPNNGNFLPAIAIGTGRILSGITLTAPISEGPSYLQAPLARRVADVPASVSVQYSFCGQCSAPFGGLSYVSGSGTMNLPLFSSQVIDDTAVAVRYALGTNGANGTLTTGNFPFVQSSGPAASCPPGMSGGGISPGFAPNESHPTFANDTYDPYAEAVWNFSGNPACGSTNFQVTIPA